MVFGDLDRAQVRGLLTTTPRRPGRKTPTRLLPNKVFGGGDVGVVLLSRDLRVQRVCGLAGTAQLGEPNCFPDNLGMQRAIRLDWIGALSQRLGGTLSANVTSDSRALQKPAPVTVGASPEVGENVQQNAGVGSVGSATTTAAGRGSAEAGDGKEAEHRKGAATAGGSTVKETGEDIASHREGGGRDVLHSVMAPRQELRAQVV